jgi:prephenate dehydrogenase
VVLDAAEHDRAVALVSHVPHTLANALLELVEHATDSPAARHLAAGSFRSGTRVAGGNAPRSLNMLVDNAAALGPALDDVIALLQTYRRELDDPAALRTRLTDVADRAHVVRTTAPDWTPCPDLAVALAEADRPLLVRRGPDGHETARA